MGRVGPGVLSQRGAARWRLLTAGIAVAVLVLLALLLAALLGGRGTGVRASALSVPLILSPPPGAAPGAAQAAGDVRIDEREPGALSPTGRLELGLPAGLTFAATPVVSIVVGHGLELVTTGPDAPRLLPGGQRFSFAVARPSSSGAATLFVSAISVVVQPGFVATDAEPRPVRTAVSGTAWWRRVPAVRNAVVVGPSDAPTLAGLSVGSVGRGATGLPVALTGANLAPGATVSLGPGIAVSGVSAAGPTTITALLDVDPAAPLGPRAVTVTNPSGKGSTLAGALVVRPAPSVTRTDRSAANPLLRGLRWQRVVVTGSSFQPPTLTPSNIRVRAGGTGIAVVEVAYASSREIWVDVDVDPGADPGDRLLTVVNPDGGVGTSTGPVLAVASPPSGPAGGLPSPPSAPTQGQPLRLPPTVTSLTPPRGLRGTPVTIGGTDFDPPVIVFFAGPGGTRVPAAIGSASATQLTVTVPGAAVDGPVVVVRTSDGLRGEASPGFTVTDPRLSTVIPASGTQGDAVTLQLVGAGLQPGVTVTLEPPGGLTLDAVTLVDSTRVRALVRIDPSAQTGPRAVRVTNPPDTGGGTALRLGSFRVTPPVSATFELSLAGVRDPAAWLPSLPPDGVSVTLDAGGRCLTRTIAPGATGMTARFSSPLAGARPPASVRFKLTSSALPGTATNEDCEPGPATPDFSVGQPTVTSQEVTVDETSPGSGLYQTTLYAHDWGGTVAVEVSGIMTGGAAGGAGLPVSATFTLPVDTDGDGLPDAYEENADLNANEGGINVLSRLDDDQDGNGQPDGVDRFAPDGLSHAMKYRGVYLGGPARGPAGSTATGLMTGHARLGAGMRHLFVRGLGFGNDPRIQATPGTCGQDAAGAPVPDPTISASNPCPRFQVGRAFANAGVHVHDVTATELPRRSLKDGTALLDLAEVVYDATGCAGTITSCDTMAKFGVRAWVRHLLGWSSIGDPDTYAQGNYVYKRAVDSYFGNRSYQHRTNCPPARPNCFVEVAGRAVLAPIGLVGDCCSTAGTDNGSYELGEALGLDQRLAGDTYIAESFTEQLSVMDVTNDGCVERPEVGDPTAVPSCLDRTADWAPYPQATKQQVVRSVITHELGHAVGVSIHTSTDAGDIMLDYSTNWTRDDHFSADAAPMISIHNKGLR